MLDERWLSCSAVDHPTGLLDGANGSASVEASACLCNVSLVAAVGQRNSLVLDARLTNVTLTDLAQFKCYAFAALPQQIRRRELRE